MDFRGKMNDEIEDVTLLVMLLKVTQGLRLQVLMLCYMFKAAM